jgi:hypothetical protein
MCLYFTAVSQTTTLLLSHEHHEENQWLYFPFSRKFRTKLASGHQSAFGIRASRGFVSFFCPLFPLPDFPLTIYLAILHTSKYSLKEGKRRFFLEADWKLGQRGSQKGTDGHWTSRVENPSWGIFWGCGCCNWVVLRRGDQQYKAEKLFAQAISWS